MYLNHFEINCLFRILGTSTFVIGSIMVSLSTEHFIFVVKIGPYVDGSGNVHSFIRTHLNQKLHE